MKCFLGCSFDDCDKMVLRWFCDFLGLLPGIEVLLAKDKPQGLQSDIEECITQCDFMCVVITRRKEGFSHFVGQEAAVALHQGKTLLVFVEDGVPLTELGLLSTGTRPAYFTREMLDDRLLDILRLTNNTVATARKPFSSDELEQYRALSDKLVDEVSSLRFDMETVERTINRRDDN